MQTFFMAVPRPVLLPWLLFTFLAVIGSLFDIVLTAPHLSIRGTDRAVIDSQLSFVAELTNETLPKVLEYDWTTDACGVRCEKTTIGGSTSKVAFTVTSYDAPLPGKYIIIVFVYKRVDQTKREQVAHGSHQFILTDKLNGELDLIQNGSISRAPGVFSTHVPLKLHANIHDALTDLVGYICTWTLHGPQNITQKTYGTSAEVSVNTRGRYKVVANVTAQLEVNDLLNYTHRVIRSRVFTTDADFFDPVVDVNVVGDRSYTQGQNMTIIIECSGSPPFLFNLTILGPDQRPLEQRQFSSSCCTLLVTRYNLSSVGRYLVSYNISNEVDGHHGNISVNVNKRVNAVSTDVVSVLAVIIGILAPSMIIYVYMKEHPSKRSIESANFSFHPSSKDRGFYGNVKHKLKKWVRILGKKRKRVAGKELQGTVSVMDTSETDSRYRSPGSERSSGSNTSYGSTAASFQCGASGTEGPTVRRSSTPWLEQSSEHPNCDSQQTHWLVENQTRGQNRDRSRSTDNSRGERSGQSESEEEGVAWRPGIEESPEFGARLL